MEVIPVIDIKDGCAVHAIKGKRSNYRPIKTELCPSSEPADVIARYMELGNFSRVYVADLNSIMGQGNNDELISRMSRLYRNLTFWIDNGFRQSSYLSDPMVNHISVIGSESLDENRLYTMENFPASYILSLDYSSDGKLGPEPLFTNERFWPENIIIMTLGQVGNNEGPDYQKLEYFRCQYPDRNFIAAGGIRNIEDLLELKKMGIETALVASALHSKSITTVDINRLRKIQIQN